MSTHTEILDKIDRNSVLTESGCIEWQKSKVRGYGMTSYKGKRWLVHRLIYVIKNGEIDADKEIDHLCKNKSCINVDHLEQVTHSENLLRSNPSETNWHKKKTHCPKGHPYSGDNLLLRKSSRKKGYRECRTCNRARWLAYSAKKREIEK